MARVTVEDCVVVVPNRFELVALAAQRAREVSAGAPLTVERDNDKNPVVALREIAERTVDLEELQDSLIHGMQKHVEPDEPEEDDMAVLMASDQWGGGEQQAVQDDEEVDEPQDEAEAEAAPGGEDDEPAAE